MLVGSVLVETLEAKGYGEPSNKPVWVMSHPTLGKVATIEKNYPGQPDGWHVFPYCIPAYERGTVWQSLEAAKAYTVALAHEMIELGLPKPKVGPSAGVLVVK